MNFAIVCLATRRTLNSCSRDRLAYSFSYCLSSARVINALEHAKIAAGEARRQVRGLTTIGLGVNQEAALFD